MIGRAAAAGIVLAVALVGFYAVGLYLAALIASPLTVMP